MIMCKDAKAIGLDLANKCGWHDISVPKEVLIDSRMHLNREQAKDLAKKLKYFAKHGCLKEE